MKCDLLYPEDVEVKYTALDKQCTIDNDKDLHLPKPNANFLKRTVAYRAMTLWNKMPEVIRNADGKKTLKTLYRKYYLENL